MQSSEAISDAMEAVVRKRKRFRRGCVFVDANTWYFRAGTDFLRRLGFKQEIKTEYEAWVKALPLLFEANGLPLPTVPAPPQYIYGTATVELRDGAWLLCFKISNIPQEVQIGTLRKYRTQEEAESGAAPLIRRVEDGNWKSLMPQPSSAWYKPDYTTDEFTEKLAEQDGKCAICGEEARRLEFDHDHRTGVLRDLLCGKCNRAIGLMCDNPARLESAATYLRRHGK
jgi:hypothetical protein